MNRVLQGDVFDVLPALAPGSVDCCVTSPPYWMLRSYLPKDHPLKSRELGSEKTPAEFVANMVKVFELVKTAMADHGTCWVNIGDSYTHAPGKRKPTDAYGAKQLTNGYEATTGNASAPGIESGNLCLIPQRLMIALQDAGWIVRSVVIWHKPAPMPASLSGWQWRRCRVKVKAQGKSGLKLDSCGIGNSPPYPGNGIIRDAAQWADCPGCKKCSHNDGYVLRRGSWRPTSSYEPVLMLAKSSSYFADGEPVKTAPASATVSRDQYTRILDDPDEQFAVAHDHETLCDGANLRDVWRISSEPLGSTVIPTRVSVPLSEATCDTIRIPSADCPVHGPQDGLRNMSKASSGEQPTSPVSRISGIGDCPVSAPGGVADAIVHGCSPKQGETKTLSHSPNDKQLSTTSETLRGTGKRGKSGRSKCSQDQHAASSCGRQDDSSATGRSTSSRKKGHGCETSVSGTPCEEIDHDTACTEAELSSSGQRHDMPESIKSAAGSDDSQSNQNPAGNGGNSDGSALFCSCSYYTPGQKKVDHYAAYPTALVEKCLRAGTSAKGYCPECGAPWVRIVESELIPLRGNSTAGPKSESGDGLTVGRSAGLQSSGHTPGMNEVKTIGWRASCPHHDLTPRPGLVLDPFGGSGRTAITAQQLGLDSVSVELNPEYVAMARRLIYDDMPLMNVMGIG